MSGINNYFSNNNIFNGIEIPTQGKFDVGDIVVNIGENAEEEPMWMCIEAGEPGVWKVVGKVEEMDLSGLLTESKDLVGAINELFQSANNGKELIANAIGEPLDSNDTFSAMSNDINGLLSTFKTNMMNSGVTVESGDKFKALIDKIKGLTEGNGKGIQFVEGSCNFTSDITDTIEKTFTYDDSIGFSPSYLMLVGDLTYDGNTSKICIINNNETMNIWFSNSKASARPLYIKITNVDSNSVTLLFTFTLGEVISPITVNFYYYYAIGVGEDTTNSGLDIISATELPATGRENQICVITDNPVNLFYITSNYDDVFNNDDGITLYVGDSTTHDGHLGNLVTVNMANVKQNYYIYKVLQGHTTRLSSYIYRNSQWEQLTQKSVSIMEDKVYVTGGNFIFNTSNPCVLYNTTDGLQLKGSGVSGSVGSYEGHNRSGTTLKTLINFSDFNKIRIKARHSFFTSDSYGELPTKIVAFSGTNSSTYREANVNAVLRNLGAVDQCDVFITEARNGIEPLEFEIDISNWSGSYYLGFAMHSEDQYSGTVYISDIELY